MTSLSFDVALARDPAERDYVSMANVESLAARPGGAADDDGWALLEATGGLALQIGATGCIHRATDASAQLLDYPREYLLRASVLDIVAVDERTRLNWLLQRCAQDGSPRRDRFRFVCGIRSSRWIDLRISRHADGDRPELLLMGHDVTDYVEKERQLVEMSYQDPLTGVGNRAYIRNRIAAFTASGQPNPQLFAVALMDLDGFKKVNDSLGHEFGDALLKEIGKRLQDALRSREMVARLGGDEFVLLLEGLTTESDAIRILERVIHVCRQPFHLGGCQVRITTSIGLAFSGETSLNESQWLRRADLAMYEAKALGKNRYCLYSPEFEHRLDEQFRIEQSMFEAVQNGEFLLHYQPIVWPGSGEVCATEALMRWEHPQGAIAPDVFIPMAENNGLIKHLGAWALRCACAQLASWDAQGIHVRHMSVNVSPVQFRHPGFLDSVRNAIHDAGIAPDRIILEITESALMTDPAATEALLMELRALGIRFAVDDFGTGYSSLSYLRRFPLSALKIDRSFVSDMMDSPHARTIVSAVMSLSRELGLVAIAEGVESDEQSRLLSAQGCTLVQGWRYAQALSPGEFERAIQTGTLSIGQADVFSAQVQ
ncbi:MULTISPECIES: putative bifunctional diguanylate cyclase/phosphodiesterase [unclassified Cupriavidus]|uniref:putative bifunctional diguanylate cyclase/phosphodiesterase n=1 Tax=Cupriavidus sp. H19C3 TaxID=3241603 RepID=UPI0011DB3ECC|nr:MAG: EAL domain-containing protein [Cupriavidus sp.]